MRHSRLRLIILILNSHAGPFLATTGFSVFMYPLGGRRSTTGEPDQPPGHLYLATPIEGLKDEKG